MSTTTNSPAAATSDRSESTAAALALRERALRLEDERQRVAVQMIGAAVAVIAEHRLTNANQLARLLDINPATSYPLYANARAWLDSLDLEADGITDDTGYAARHGVTVDTIPAAADQALKMLARRRAHGL